MDSADQISQLSYYLLPRQRCSVIAVNSKQFLSITAVVSITYFDLSLKFANHFKLADRSDGSFVNTRYF